MLLARVIVFHLNCCSQKPKSARIYGLYKKETTTTTTRFAVDKTEAVNEPVRSRGFKEEDYLIIMLQKKEFSTQ